MGTVELSWVELKLFVREPLTVIFSLALPLIILFILGGVFGDQPTTVDGSIIYRGAGAMSYYVPAYLALVIASICVISIPTHLAGSRERGILKRLHASSIAAWEVAVAQVTVAMVLSLASGVLLLTAASLTYDFDSPLSIPAVIGVLLLLVLGFSAFGIFLGAVLPTARSAQAVGMLVWFIMLFVGGAGPPPEILTNQMQQVADFTPLWHAVLMMQDAWLGLDAGLSWAVFGIVGFLSAILGIAFFRWE